MNSSRNGLGMWKAGIAREWANRRIHIPMRLLPKFITRSRACLMAHEGSQIIREAMTTIAR
jgi:hypothetical protein